MWTATNLLAQVRQLAAPTVQLSLAIMLALMLHREPALAREIDLLGRDLVVLDVPPGLLVLRKSRLEHGEHEIRRAHGQLVMKIIQDGALQEDVVDYSAIYYCVNGIEGLTDLKHGVRKILLLLPPEGEEYRFYLEYLENDSTAIKIMRTFTIKGFHKRCPHGAVHP